MTKVKRFWRCKISNQLIFYLLNGGLSSVGTPRKSFYLKGGMLPPWGERLPVVGFEQLAMLWEGLWRELFGKELWVAYSCWGHPADHQQENGDLSPATVRRWILPIQEEDWKTTFTHLSLWWDAAPANTLISAWWNPEEGDPAKPSSDS